MKRILFILAVFPLIVSAQTQTFNSVARFTTNVFLHDSTTPLHLRVPTNAVIDGVISSDGSATITTNAGVVDIAAGGGAGWSGFAATGTVSVGTNAINSQVYELVIITNSTGNMMMGLFTNAMTVKHGAGSAMHGSFNSQVTSYRNEYNLLQGSVVRGRVANVGNGSTNSLGVGSTLIIGSGFAPGRSDIGAGATVVWNGSFNDIVVAGSGGITLKTAEGGDTVGSITNSGQGSIFTGRSGTYTSNNSIYAQGEIRAGGNMVATEFIGSAAGLTGFPASLVTVSAANTNYYRFTTPPESNTAFGLQHQIAYNSTNIFIYHAASSKWLRVTGTLEW